MVERFLPKEDVASSNLVSRSSFPPGSCTRRRAQVVRERSAKPLCTSSILVGASKFEDSFSRRFPLSIQMGTFFFGLSTQ